MSIFKGERRILLVGKTGTGKSSTGNTILNKKIFRAEASFLSVTGKSSFGTRTYNNKQLIVVDTPGLLDTHRDEKEIKTEIIKSICISVPGPHAVLYVMRVGDRFTRDERTCIEKFTKEFGENIFNFVIVVFTRKNDLNGTQLSEYVSNVPGPLQDLLKKCEYRMLAIDNEGTDEQKLQAVNDLLEMIDTMICDHSFYTNDMVKCATEAFLKRMKEIGQAADVRGKIQREGTKVMQYLISAGDNTMEIYNEVRFVLVGRTGTGISSTGNAILNKDFSKRSVVAVSVTKECESGESIRNGTKVIVVDTPGLFNNKLKHTKVKNEISKCIIFLSKGPHAFIYIFRISRHSKEEEQTLVELDNIFGRFLCKYCILLFVTDNPVMDKKYFGVSRHITKLL